MVLFQLLCGVRPYSHYKEQEINRAVYSGERPNLKKYTSVTSFPKLEQLMYACWQVVSYERPSASAIISEVNLTYFYTLLSCLIGLRLDEGSFILMPPAPATEATR